MVDFKGIGSPGPICPICSEATKWLTDPVETNKSDFQCMKCLRIFNYYLGMIVWWPNDQDVAPPHGGAADKVYTIIRPKVIREVLDRLLGRTEEEEDPPGTRIRYRYV